MSTEAFADRVREVLDSALERPAHEREAFVAGLCGSDERLQGEVVSLLRALQTGGDALEPPPVRPPPAAEPLTGLKFGPYQVAERLGQGGMGVVYRAQDTRLGRTVAVKALPASVARDAHGRARFEHEARVLASLNHPNIAAIYGVEDTARGPVMVLEFVAGESLAHRLAAGRLPLDEAVSIAVSITRGLEAAHAAGVVHRDLKPANIQLAGDGGVKILDFGIAKQAAPGSDAAPLLTAPGGVIGTAGYMSPEQARGRPVDRRTDLWAFGCLLYEMLCGRRAFEGDTTSDTVAAVLRADPDWTRLPAETPPSIARLLRRCLERDPDRRLRDAGDARLELELSEPDAPTPARARATVWVGITGAAAVIAFAAGMLSRRPSAGGPEPAAPVRFHIDLAHEGPLSFAMGGALAVAPDGRSVVYAAGAPVRPRLYLRGLGADESQSLPGTEHGQTPFFSPDGRWLGYVQNEGIRRLPLAGGPSELVVESGVYEVGCSWGPDGAVVFVGREGAALYRVPCTGGTPQEIIAPALKAGTHGFAHPDVLPVGDAVLFTGQHLRGDTVDVNIEAVIATDAAAARRGDYQHHRVVVPGAVSPRFVAPDRLLFCQSGALMIAPFDARSVRVTGEASVVQRPLAGGELLPMPRFSVSSGAASGVLAWLPGNITYDLSRLAWFDLDGANTVITEGNPSIDCPRLSPDGTRVAVLIGRAGGDVYVHDLARATRLRLTTGDYRHHAVWSPDGQHIACTRTTPHQPVRLERMAADGTGSIEVLREAANDTILYPTDFLPDGRRLLVTWRPAPDSSLNVLVFDTESRAEPEALLPPGADRYGARISPDGRLIAYTSEETETEEVYLHEFPAIGSKVRVSTDGGYRPVWSRDGKQLFYRYLNRLSVVDVTPPDGAGRPVSVSAPRVLFEHLPDARYEVSADGRRFLMARPTGDWGPQTRINVVVGWDGAAP